MNNGKKISIIDLLMSLWTSKVEMIFGNKMFTINKIIITKTNYMFKISIKIIKRKTKREDDEIIFINRNSFNIKNKILNIF